MNFSEYQDFKLKVLAKCDGKNIHGISGMLGHLINCISLREKYNNNDNKKLEEDVERRLNQFLVSGTWDKG